MNELNNKDHEFFKNIISKSKLEVPFSDFEDVIMSKINTQVLVPKTSRELKFSLLFFVLGTIAGILISVALANIEDAFFGLSPKLASVLFQVLFVTLVFTQTETFIKLVKNLKLNK